MKKPEKNKTSFFIGGFAQLAFLTVISRIFGFLRDIILEKNITRNKIITTKQSLVVQVLSALDNPNAQNILVEASKSWFLPNDIKALASANIKRK